MNLQVQPNTSASDQLHQFEMFKSEPRFDLVIDKISITKDEPDNEKVAAAIDRLTQLIKTGQVQGRIRSSARYRTAFVIDIDGTSKMIPERLLIEVGPRFLGVASYRVEFNPNKMGLDGVRKVFGILGTMIDTDGDTFLTDGKVTRLDVALDLTTRLKLNDVIIWYKGRRKFGFFTDQRGRIETQYNGSQRGNQNSTYDKDRTDDSEGILRVEQRLKNGFLGRDLHRIANPFEKLLMVETSNIVPALGVQVPEFFFAYARTHGIGRATNFVSRRQAANQIIDEAEREFSFATSRNDLEQVAGHTSPGGFWIGDEFIINSLPAIR